jgi:hypothetical protein
MNTPQNQIIIIIIIPIYKIFNTRCVNCARCQNCNRRMYIISSMEVLISLLIIHPSEPFSSLTGFFIPSFCKGCLLIGQQNVLVPLCTYVLKEFTIQIWKPNPNSTFTLFEMVSFRPCRRLLWNVHPSNEGSWNNNHWAKVISFLTCGWNIPFYPCTPQIMDVKVAIASKPVG